MTGTTCHRSGRAKLEPTLPEPMRSGMGYSADRPSRSMRCTFPLTESWDWETLWENRAVAGAVKPTDRPIPVRAKLFAISEWQDSHPG